MRRASMAILLLFMLILVGCQEDIQSPLEIDMFNSDGDSIGTATLSEQADGVQVKLSLEGLAPGLHGIHVHEFPNCEGPDFKSAGSHLNPEGNQHGLMHPEGAHLGDLPNVEVDAEGMAEAELMVNGATLTDGKNSLLKEDGTSLVLHDGQDDGVSQPGGESGERIACGKIQVGQSGGNESPTDPTKDNKEKEEK
ncbi:superoxide dismutase family protein [Sediminibacillus albus]|uniref:Superoxide dismutase, Cu-Zn family n=1 Tax=Sediminibacillus albus TaxID=407036 RepID=A0A1G8YZR3_9BACI|nr:superoxide dismutase family protein [Sediminibacillus albus]SDK08271.1 superoxide dismutase, Cu-Zn family [Sediminibacillus albus]